MSVTGRFAPTPSGPLHLGNILCAMLAWLSARAQGGSILLRIEDVDVPRCPEANTRACIEALAWLGFTWDGPPLYQRERTAVYEEALARLNAQGLVCPCFCTRAELHPELAPNLGDTQAVYPGTCRSLSLHPPSSQALRMHETASGALFAERKKRGASPLCRYSYRSFAPKRFTKALRGIVFLLVL